MQTGDLFFWWLETLGLTLSISCLTCSMSAPTALLKKFQKMKSEFRGVAELWAMWLKQASPVMCPTAIWIQGRKFYNLTVFPLFEIDPVR